MRPLRGQNSESLFPKVKAEFEIEKKLIEQIDAMEVYTKIPKSELIETALKRFISQHKDYLPGHHK